MIFQFFPKCGTFHIHIFFIQNNLLFLFESVPWKWKHLVIAAFVLLWSVERCVTAAGGLLRPCTALQTEQLQLPSRRRVGSSEEEEEEGEEDSSYCSRPRGKAAVCTAEEEASQAAPASASRPPRQLIATQLLWWQRRRAWWEVATSPSRRGRGGAWWRWGRWRRSGMDTSTQPGKPLTFLQSEELRHNCFSGSDETWDTHISWGAGLGNAFVVAVMLWLGFLSMTFQTTATLIFVRGKVLRGKDLKSLRGQIVVLERHGPSVSPTE